MILHDRIIDFYKKNPEVVKFILDFFKLKKGKKGVRSRVVHNMREGRVPIIYCQYGLICFTDINRENLWRLTREVGTIHFREWAYDEIVRKVDRSKIEGYEFEEHRMGVSVVLDIDAPTFITGNKEVKVDFFGIENGNDYFDDFQKAKRIIEKELDELGLEYNCLFSGNGIYLIIESDYPKKLDELLADTYINKTMNTDEVSKINEFWDVEYVSKIRANIVDINRILYENGVLCSIDPRWKAWSVYHKIPFTYHGSKDRLSIPICKGDMNKEWMDYVTNLDNLDKINVSEIIKRANWRTDIW